MRARANDAPRDPYLAKPRQTGDFLLNMLQKKEQRQVNKKFHELKGGNIGIAEKAQETRYVFKSTDNVMTC